MKWTDELTEKLKEVYPRLGVLGAAQVLGLRKPQIRMKASRLGLRAAGTSDAWKLKQKAHAEILRGRKRPDQSIVMKRLHAEGKLIKTQEQIEKASKRMKAWIAENGHPRGALGYAHTSQTKELLSKKSLLMWEKMKPADRRAQVMKMLRTKVKNGVPLPHRTNATWKAGWREIGGIRKYYRSRWEANYARYLQWLLERGELSSWEHEPKTFWFEGVRRGAVSYLPDFRVVEKNGREAYHEVKGWMDSRSKTKIKRMKKYHPEITLIVIDSKSYKSISRQVGGMILGWE